MSAAYSRRQGCVLGNHAQSGYRRRNQSSNKSNDGRTRKPFEFKPGDTVTLAPVITPDNLVTVFQQLKHAGGKAPGLDNIRYSDLGSSEMWDAMRKLSKVVEKGTYRPQPPRIVVIAKKAGGSRELRLRVILDRVLAAAVYYAINKIIDPTFSPYSVGFRPRRDRLEILAAIEAGTREGQWVIAEDDVTKAFDNVLISRTLFAFAKYIPDTGFMNLIERVLRGESVDRLVGIDQGSALSPLALNVLLDEVLDRPLHAAYPGNPLWKFADNLCATCTSATEAVDLLSTARQLLNPLGMSLKGHVPVDLREKGTQVNILGYSLRRDTLGQLSIEIPEDSWKELGEDIQGTWQTPHPGRAALDVARGWINAQGPCLGDVGRLVGRVIKTLTRQGHQEIDTQVLHQAAVGARTRWEETIREHRAHFLLQRTSLESTPVLEQDVGSRTTVPPDRPTADGGYDHSPAGLAVLAH